MKAKCKHCGNSEIARNRKAYCSEKCKNRAHYLREKIKKPPTSQTRTCINCGYIGVRFKYCRPCFAKIRSERYREARIKYSKTEICKQKKKERKNKMRNDPSAKIAKSLRRNLSRFIKNKQISANALLGCNYYFFRSYLEERFVEGMCWENYGFYGWHIDHIKPCASFNLTDIEQQKICFHYTNLQPLWGVDNLKKGSALPPEPQTASLE